MPSGKLKCVIKFELSPLTVWSRFCCILITNQKVLSLHIYRNMFFFCFHTNSSEEREIKTTQFVYQLNSALSIYSFALWSKCLCVVVFICFVISEFGISFPLLDSYLEFIPINGIFIHWFSLSVC